MNEPLYEQLKKASEVLLCQMFWNIKLQDLSDEVDNQCAEIAKKEQWIKEDTPLGYGARRGCGGFIAFFGFPLTIISLIMFFTSISYPSMILTSITCMFVGILLSCIAIALFMWAKFSKKRNFEKAMAEHKKEAEEVQKLCSELLDEYNRREQDRDAYMQENQHFLEFLPKPYRNAKAVAFMLDAVHNLRADTLKEAINLYEQELKHEAAMEAAEMQRIQSEDMLYAMQLAQSTLDANNAILEDIRLNEYIERITKPRD